MHHHGEYPRVRLRRNRKSDWVRRLVAEHRLTADDLIWPLFVQEGENLATPVPSMPGVERLSIDRLVIAAKSARDAGIPAIAIFPVIDASLKNPQGSLAYAADNLVCRAVKAVKAAVSDIGIICDVALDPFTSHGQDGIVLNGDVENDATVDALIKQALVQAEAGCDIIAPSDMMDGRIGAIRDALDAAGYTQVSILSYAAKYASAFYGPFRDAVGSSAQLKGSGKHTYQMDPPNALEALREVELDIAEGADMVMIKPGLPYLDIIRMVKDKYAVPVFAYQVSGEYAMIKAAAEKGWLDGDRAMMESLLSLKRAGARGIFTYAALDIARALRA